jgi:hypothetical protein
MLKKEKSLRKKTEKQPTDNKETSLRKKTEKQPTDNQKNSSRKNNRKQIFQKRWGGDKNIYDNDKIIINNLSNLRTMSSKCCYDKNAIKYISDVCELINNLIIQYSNDKNIDYSETLKFYLSGNEIGSDISSAGQTSSDDLIDVIKNGNLREQMTIIMNFAKRGCIIVIWAICNDSDLINEQQKNEITKRFFKLTGLSDMNKIQAYITKYEGILPCSFVSLAQDGNVSASRMTSFPMVNGLRDVRKDSNNDVYKVKKDNVCPPLSTREIKYMSLTEADRYLPWITGFRYWKINEKNFYIQLMKENKQLIIAGPSGNTDLQLNCLRLFKNFDLKYSIIACVAWMCNPPDHSPCEILLAAIPFGLDDWDITMDSFGYIEKLLKDSSSNTPVSLIPPLTHTHKKKRPSVRDL